MNRAELIAAAEIYTHDPLGDNADRIIEQAEADVWRVLRVPEMETFAEIDTEATPAVQGNQWALPDDYIEMRDVYTTVGGVRHRLRRVGAGELAMYASASGSTALVYAIQDRRIELAPGPGGKTISLLYYAKPSALVEDTDTNAVIAAHPGAYLFGCLHHYWIIAQDGDQASSALNLLTTEAGIANRYGWSARAAVAMNRNSGRTYRGRGAQL